MTTLVQIQPTRAAVHASPKGAGKGNTASASAEVFGATLALEGKTDATVQVDAATGYATGRYSSSSSAASSHVRSRSDLTSNSPP